MDEQFDSTWSNQITAKKRFGDSLQMENTPMSVSETVEVMDLKMDDIDEQFDSTWSNQITAKKRKTGGKTGTSLYAVGMDDDLIIASDGRICDSLFGKVLSDDTVKIHWVYKDVFLLGAGDIKTIKTIAYSMKMNSEFKRAEVKDMDFFPTYLTELANKIPKKEVEPISFVIAGRLQADGPPKLYEVDLSDQLDVNEYTYEKGGVSQAKGGSGEKFITRFCARNYGRFQLILDESNRQEMKNYVRDTIGAARKMDPGTDGNVNILSMFKGSDVVYETAIPLDLKNPRSGYSEWMVDGWKPHNMPVEEPPVEID